MSKTTIGLLLEIAAMTAVYWVVVEILGGFDGR